MHVCLYNIPKLTASTSIIKYTHPCSRGRLNYICPPLCYVIIKAGVFCMVTTLICWFCFIPAKTISNFHQKSAKCFYGNRTICSKAIFKLLNAIYIGKNNNSLFQFLLLSHCWKNVTEWIQIYFLGLTFRWNLWRKLLEELVFYFFWIT